MIIKNSLVYQEDKTFQKGELILENGVFQTTATDTKDVIDAQDCYAIPGLVDIHFHGCMGYDFCDGTKQAIEKIAEYEASVGVTTIVPATMTIQTDQLAQVMQTAGEYENEKGAKLEGINMEGPFINSDKKGAQDAKYIRNCSIEMYQQFQRLSNGLIKLVDIAPETNDAFDFIAAIKGQTTISIAHTCADYETANLAFQKGASHVTHLYNAMLPFSHREPGVVGAAFDNKHTYVELICDGVHIHPCVVRATFAMFGEDRIVFISDSMRATGLKDGQYTLGGQEVAVRGNRATLVKGTALAGSVTNLADCVRTAVQKMEIPLESAVACATINPAKSIGIYDKCGSITPGKAADVVLLNKDLSLRAVFINGKQINI